jgi:hypothetical protein
MPGNRHLLRERCPGSFEKEGELNGERSTDYGFGPDDGVSSHGGGWASSNAPLGTFSGTITKVDLANQELVVQNNDGEMTFQWNNKTQVNGLPIKKVGLDSNNLKEGMKVIVFYREGDRNRVANWIDVRTSNLKTLKGLSFPFECGVRVC